MRIPPYITADELVTVKKHFLLGTLLDVFERDKQRIAQSGIKTPAPYTDMIDRAMDAVTSEIKTVRQRMRSAGIKTHSETRSGWVLVQIRLSGLCRRVPITQQLLGVQR